jgi:hypothetical protein
VNNGIGFTGYVINAEADICYARERLFKSSFGRFLSRDPLATRIVGGVFVPQGGDGYHDGASLYAGYFVPRKLDPFGMNLCCPDECDVVGGFTYTSDTDWEWIPWLNGPGHNDPKLIPDMVNTVDNANAALEITGGALTGMQTGAAAAATGIGKVGSVATGVGTGLIDPAVDQITPSPSDFSGNTSPSVNRRNDNAGYDLRIRISIKVCKEVPCKWRIGNDGCMKKSVPFDSGWRRISVRAPTSSGDPEALKNAILSITNEGTAGADQCQ